MGGCISLDDTSDDDVGCGTPHSSSASRRSRQKHSRRRIMQVLAAEAKANEILYRTEGRMCGNGSSSHACIFTQQGRKGINQDAMIVWENFDSSPDTVFCGVFDGHGPFGHLVARKVRDSLPTKIVAARSETNKASSAMTAASEVSSTEEMAQKWFGAWRDSFMKSYHAMDKELKAHPTIDCFCSGTTAVTMLLQGKDMLVANVGDSRAVLGTLSADNSKVEAVQITVDLKPNLPLEAERIKRCKGRVFALEDEPEVARVWLPHDDSPGLAMARAFGDFCLKDFGLIAVPEVTYTRITERDQFIVLASDGIWDVLSNQEVVETIWEAPTRTTAARALVETAVRSWRLKYPTSKVDDCAVVCFFFNKHGTAQQLRQNLSIVSAAADMKTPETEEAVEMEMMMDTDSSISESGNLFQRSDTLRSGAIADDAAAAVLSPSSDTVELPLMKEAAPVETSPSSSKVLVSAEAGDGTSPKLAPEAKRNSSSSEQHPYWSMSSDSDGGSELTTASRNSPDSAPTQPAELMTDMVVTTEQEEALQTDSSHDGDDDRGMQVNEENVNGTGHLEQVEDVGVATLRADGNGSTICRSDADSIAEAVDEDDSGHSHKEQTNRSNSDSRTEQEQIEDAGPELCHSDDDGYSHGHGEEVQRDVSITTSDDEDLQMVDAGVDSRSHGGEAQRDADSSTIMGDDKEEQVQQLEEAKRKSEGAMWREWGMAKGVLGTAEEAASEITLVTDEEDSEDGAKAVLGRSASRKSLAECLSVADDEEWSALEGVARVNSLLKLPRFLRAGPEQGRWSRSRSRGAAEQERWWFGRRRRNKAQNRKPRWWSWLGRRN